MITTSKGYEYAQEGDAVTVYPAVTLNNALLHEARPGVSAVSTSTRNGYTGTDLWDGRIIWNTTTQQLEKYNLATTTWIAAAAGASPSGTVDGPDNFGDSSAVGTSSSYARGDHKHGLPSVASLATAAALATEAATRNTNDNTLQTNINAEAAARAYGDSLLLPKLNGVLTSVFESAYVTGSPLAATQEIDVTTNSTLIVVVTYATNDFVFNVRSTPTVQLNALLIVGQAVTVTVEVAQGATPYKCTGIEIDGTTQTVNWQGGTAPTAGFASGVDVYTIHIVKTGSATYRVLASLTQF